MADEQFGDGELMEGLPRDLVIRCIAFVPYCHYGKLARLSFSWWNAIHSSELFEHRRDLNAEEELVCVFTNAWAIYDPRNNVWGYLPPIPATTIHSRSFFGVAFIAQRLFVLGGCSQYANPLTAHDDDWVCPGHKEQGDRDEKLKCSCNEVWAYDLVLREWKEQAPMAVPRTMFACCVWNEKIIVAGGLSCCGAPTSTAELYDPATNTWSPLPELQLTNMSECSGTVVEGNVHVCYDGLTDLQILEGVDAAWVVHHDNGLAQASPRANQRTLVDDELFTLNREGELRKQDGDFIASLPVYGSLLPAEEESRISGFAMTGSEDCIYLIGGLQFFPNTHHYHRLKDVVSVGIGDGHINWRLTELPARCFGGIVHGCTVIKI